jgi:serine/threonine protein kinase
MTGSDTKGPDTKILHSPVIVTNPQNHTVAMLEQLVAQGPLGEFYIGKIINPVQLLAQRIIDGEAPPSALGLDLPHKEWVEGEEPVVIEGPAIIKGIYEQAEHEWTRLQKLKPAERKDALDSLVKGYIDPDLQPNAPVGIKVVKPKVDDDELKERLNRENDLLRKFSYPRGEHPSVVRRFGKIDDTALGMCIFMEYIEGETLRDYLNRQPGKKLNPQEAVGLIVKIAEAVKYIHGNGVIHRDLKPANIILRKKDNSPVIIDFGTSKDEDVEVTQAGQRMGTLTYMAPEQYSDSRKATARCDTYSLAQMLAEMLTGEHPLPLKEEKDKVAWLQKSYHPWIIRKFFPDIHPELEVLVEAGRAKKADDRYDDDEFLVQAQRVEKRGWYFEPKEDIQTPSTILKNKKKTRDLHRKRLKVQSAGLAVKLQTRELEERLEKVRQYESVGTYAYAQSELGALETDLKEYRGNRKPFEQQISALREKIAGGLAYQGVREQLNAARQLTAQGALDYVALGDALDKIKPALDKIAQDKHPDVHKEYQELARECGDCDLSINNLRGAMREISKAEEEIARFETNIRAGKAVDASVLQSTGIRFARATDTLNTVEAKVGPQLTKTKERLAELFTKYAALAEKYQK